MNALPPNRSTVRRITAGMTVLCALLFLANAFFTATYRFLPLTLDQRKHIDGAARFVSGFADSNRRIPNSVEFASWMDQADAAGFRFNGAGYFLHTKCAVHATDFCLTFWEGDVWVTYRSGQTNLQQVEIDGRADWLLASAMAGIGLGFAAWLLIRKCGF